jgi:group I intron endonuclease
MQHELTVYLITNTANGKRYVGRTGKTLHARLVAHLRCARNGAVQPLYRAIRKYGDARFIIEPLCQVRTLGESFFAERLYTALLSARVPHGYNLSFGGAGRGFGFQHYTETKIKLSAAMRGKQISPEARAKRIGRRAWNRGVPIRAEVRAKQSAAMRGIKPWNVGVPASAEQRECLRKANLGRRVTAATRVKMSVARLGEKNPMSGKTHSPEARAKISAAALGHKRWLGKHHSQEARAKISAARRRRKTSQ